MLLLQVKSFVKKMSYDEKVIIFCGKKVRADDLSSDLTLDGFRCQCIHGSRDQVRIYFINLIDF